MALNGKIALITGCVKNLGAAIAEELVSAGANLALHYNSTSSKDNASQLEASLKRKNPGLKIAFYQGDLTTAAAVKHLFQFVLMDFGKIDIIVNTVGKVLKKPITEISEEEYDSMFAINSKAAFFILKSTDAHVSDDGKIISIVTALLGAFPGFYTRMPSGPMDTPFFYPQESPEAVEFHKSNGMGNRLTIVQDIAPLIRFLCTEGVWITGQTIFANGGYTTR